MNDHEYVVSKACSRNKSDTNLSHIVVLVPKYYDTTTVAAAKQAASIRTQLKRLAYTHNARLRLPHETKRH
jgi:hypothetical protein